MNKLNQHYQTFLTFLIAIAISCISLTADAEQTQTTAAPTSSSVTNLVPPAPDIDAAGYVLMDANSGKILASKNADVRRAPASLTKMMTVYIITEALNNGQIKLDDKVRVSKKAWSTGGSRMFLKLGQEVPVSDMIEGIIVDSGNDATVAMAEHIGGSEDTFVSLMNKEADRLGMKNTHFTDSNGLPHEEHYSTPRDLAILSRAIIMDHPKFYEENQWYAKKRLTFNGIKQYNRNRLLWRYPGTDGLKTGHTNEAGYCLVASAKRDGMRLISVVLGAPSDNARTEDSQRLLTYGFRFFKTYKVYAANEAISHPRVWKGEKKTVPAGLDEDLFITIPNGEYKNLKATTSMGSSLEAPVKKGQSLGNIIIKYNDTIVAQRPIVALADDPEGGIWTRITDTFTRSYHNWFNGAKKEG